MAEYIDKNGLIEAFNKFAPEHYNALINQLITKYPTADVVEVVRCRNCMHCEIVIDQFDNDWYCCKNTKDNAEVKPDDFCSYGERKDA